MIPHRSLMISSIGRKGKCQVRHYRGMEMLRKKKHKIWISAFLFALLVLLSPCTVAQNEVANDLISPKEAHGLLTGKNPPLLVDVRTKAEFESGHLQKALNVPLDEFAGGAYAEKIGETAKDDLIIVFCRSGRRSGIAYDILIKDGYTNVKNVEGGIIAWKDAELPIVIEVDRSFDKIDKPTSDS